MRPPEATMVACPHCGALHQAWSRSGNSLGGTMWSDGCRTGPMLPRRDAVVAPCAECGGFFWVWEVGRCEVVDDDSEVALILEAAGPDRGRAMRALRQHLDLSLSAVKAIVDGAPATIGPRIPLREARRLSAALSESGATLKIRGSDAARGITLDAAHQVPTIPSSSEAIVLSALDAGVAETTEQEDVLRRLAWWEGNDAYRGTGRPFVPYSERPDRVRANLERLFDRLPDGDPEDRMCKADAARQLRRFDEAIALLRQQTLPVKLQSSAGLILWYAEKRDDALKALWTESSGRRVYL